ncbi:gamma-glutamylcyclotransferase [Tumebacillus avium]|uniref:Gamma-glutamylcyclotransferase n=1 Tax=Tumebacillus avium TaxID=1903704 RepID=A0A1Y0IPN2_9BACL|nr:gamma-glutamylcyclotransferase family protein [Tumebacillus avium]ARU62528.1 gamma-glutamylcyclotransferase [Tumebacillus avium]
MRKIFVYGTLLTGESNHTVAAPYLLQAEPGRVRGRLYDAAQGRYPALVLDPGGEWIEGEWFLVTPEGVARMDELEEFFGPDHPDNLYERVAVCDADTGQEGEVYVWRDHRSCPPIRGRSWRTYRR